MSTPQFHALTVRDVRAETADAVSIAFEVPAALRDAYRFTQGQFLTLKATVGGEELRRAYSICVGVPEYQAQGELRVGVKRVPGGKFSNHLNDTVRIGQSFDVMTPDGRFFTALQGDHRKHYLGLAGGSGITPMLSLIKTMLAGEPQSQFTLVYGNRHSASVMFSEELEGLKNRYMERLVLIHVLSEETQEIDLFNGLLDRAKCDQLLSTLIGADTVDEAFVCGPGPMMDAAEAALLAAGVGKAHIHIERFGSFAAPVAAVTVDDATPSAALTVILDGKERQARVAFPQGDRIDTVLDAGLRTGAALPFSCRGGNCCTCRAKLVEGEVKMLKNFALNDEEVKNGFVLTCQCVPVSQRIVVSFDER